MTTRSARGCAAPAGGSPASFGGQLGVTIGRREGVELNILGLVAGVRLERPAIPLPGFGALGEPF